MDLIQVKSHRHVVASPGEGFAVLGAVWTPLQVHQDARGWFAEIWRTDLPGGIKPRQISISKTLPGVTKAFHFHNQQDDLFIPVAGTFRIVLLQTHSPFEAISIWWKEGAEGTLRIPAGLAHGYRVEGVREARMLYLTSETYSPQDEGRMEWDRHVEGFPWKERPAEGF
jgi:dTDP-4-dehydrorhamnose 3,5-epimerase